MAKTGFTQEILKPFIVLVCICLIAAALLGYTHGVTNPIILKMQEKAAQEARAAVLPGATSFTKVDCDTEALGIVEAYKEDNGLGYVMVAQNKGYGGEVVATVGLDQYGNIVGILADVSSETQGVGTKVGIQAYLDNYIGNAHPAQVDGISGATYSSNAMRESIVAIVNAFDTVKEAAK